MAELDRERILELDESTREEVPMPEWGCSVFVRPMTGDEKDWLDIKQLYDDEEKRKPVSEQWRNYRGRLVALVTCRADGSSLFHLADAEALGKKPAKVLDRIVTVAQRLNGITAEEVAALTKNSAPTPDAVPGSVSPAPSA